MTDETKPKRVRGQKEREAAYRQGYEDGYARGRLMAERDALLNAERQAEEDRAIQERLVRLRATPVVKRTRRRKDEKPDPTKGTEPGLPGYMT